MVTVIIPAKGKSERFPGKNLAEFRGKPLVQWSIEYALYEGFQPTVLSDSDTILNLAESLGAKKMHEPEHLLSLHSYDAVRWAARILKTDIVELNATAPIRSPGLIHQALELLKVHDCVYAGMPLKWFFIRDKRGKIVNREYQENGSPPTTHQLRDEPQWIQSGTIFGYRYPTLLDQMDNIYGDPGVIEITEEEMADIDWPEDLDAIQSVRI